ncbi:MAG: preprotein translocase subunit SecG [Planctomycetota bacterium]
MASLLLLGAFIHFIKGAIMLLFILTAFLLVIVVLLQEGKGGGLAGAFGGAGAQTFGVQTGGVNKFTFWVAGVFMVLAVLYATIKPDTPVAPSARESTIAPPDDEDAGSGTEEGGDAAGDSGDASGGDSSSGDSSSGESGDK